MLCSSLCCALFSLSLSLCGRPCLFTCCVCACVGAAAPCRPLCLCVCVCACARSFERSFGALSLSVRESARSLSQVHFFLLLCLGKNESKAGQITKKRRICCASHAARFCFGLRAALFISSGGASTALPIVCRCIGMRARRSRSRRRRCVCFCV